MTKTKTKPKPKETYEISGEKLLAKVKELIKEGNIREITIKDKKGKTLVVLPLALGVVGAVLLPPLAVVSAIAALVTECTITVKRK